MKIDAAKFEALIVKSGLKSEALPSRVKVYGATGRQVLVPNGKSVSIVWFVGFEHATGVPAGKHTTGTVTQVLDWSGTEDEVLARFEAALAHLATLPAIEKQKKAAAPKKDAPKGFTQIKVDEKAQAEAKAKRKALIEDQAKRSGKPVSAKTKAELDSSSTNGVSAQ